MNRKFKNRIAWRLVFWFVVCSSLIAGVATSALLYLDYHQDLNDPIASLTQVVSQHGDGPSPVAGRLAGFADVLSLRHHFTNRLFLMFLGNTITILLAAGLIYFLCQRLVARHLETLALKVRLLDLASPFTPLQLENGTVDRHDEMARLVSAVNTMYLRGHDAYETIDRDLRQLRQFMDACEEAIIGVDRQGVCVYANKGCLGLLNLDDYGQILNRKFDDLVIQSDVGEKGNAPVGSVVFRAMAQPQSLRCEEGVVAGNAGQTRHAVIRCYPVYENSEVCGAVVFISGNRGDRLLRREWQLLSEAVKQVAAMIIIVDRDNIIEFVNASVERLTGFASEELLGQSAFGAEKMFVTDAARHSAIKAALRVDGLWEGELSIRTKRQTTLQCSAIISAVQNEIGQVKQYVAVCKEISYELALQNELVNAKKMEVVGRLSAKFAHEFGNPLFGVRSVLKDFCNRTELTTEDSRLLYLAHQECERMRVMIREFQQLYEDSTRAEEIENLSDLINKVLQNTLQLRESLQVDCTVDLADDKDIKIYHKNKLFLVFRNIVINALESMTHTGGRMAISDRKNGQYLLVSIADQGRGIDREHQEMIFEPFFSTKSEVEGAGLGLSVAYGTMKSIGGNITFMSRAGEGTTFIVHIPIR